MILRPAAAADHPAILALWNPLIRETTITFSSEEKTPAALLTPQETAQINAQRKARACAGKFPDHLVLGADTVVSLGTEVFGKPLDLAEAERMLARLQGRTHLVTTGVCLLHRGGHRQRIFAVATLVTFRKLSGTQIRRYLARIQPLDKAGGYAIQDEGALIVKNFSGSFSNVVGLRWNSFSRSWRLGIPSKM